MRGALLMRKVVSILVSLILLVSIVSQSAFATTPTMFGITVGNAEGLVGSTVKIPVSFLNGAALAVNNIDFKLAYDPNALELISIDPGEIVTYPAVNFSSYISSGKASLLFVDESGGKDPISKSGVFANLNFKIKTAAKSQITFYSLGALNEMLLRKSSGFSLIEGSVAGTEISTQNSVTPDNVKIDKAALDDVSIAVTPESNFADIQNGSVSLIKDTDYTVSGAKVVIKKSYINYYFTKFSEQNLNLDVVFKSGKNVKLCIYTGTSSLPSISPSTITYNVESNQDIAVKTELNGNYISSVIVGEKVLLLPRIDYTYSTTDKTTIIRKGFLQSYFNTNRSQAKFVINFTGGSSVPLTINPLYPQQPHNELSPALATFEAGKASDIVVTKIPGGTNFVGITYKVQTLTDGKDYTVSGDKVTLKASFLNTLPEGNSELVFVSTPGNKVNFNIAVTKPQTTNAGITVTIGSVKADADNTAIVPVSFNNITSSINNIDFKLGYDVNAVDSISVTPGEIVPNPAVNFLNRVTDGKIYFLFTDDTQKSQQITKDGIFAYIKVKLKSGYSGTDIKLFQQGACNDLSLKTIPMTFVDGKVTKDQTNGVTITVGTLKVEAPANNTVTLPVSINGITTPINNLDFKLSYDVNAVDSITITPGDIVPNPAQNFGSSVIGGKITFLFTDETQGAQQIAKDGVFANITIKFKAGSASMPVKLLKKGACNDSKLAAIPVTFVDGAVSVIIPPPIQDKGITVTLGSPKKDAGTVTLPISLNGIPSSVNNLDFKLYYDQKAVDVVSVTAGDIIPNPNVNFCYSAVNGKIVLLFTDETQGSQQITKDGVFANITFKVKTDYTDSTVRVADIGAFCDANLNKIPVTFNYGIISAQ